MKGRTLVEVMRATRDGKDAILATAKTGITDSKLAEGCAVRAAGIDGWPTDALVIDVGAAEAAKAPKDEPRAACSPYGLDEDAQIFWRVAGGYGWFFNLGQDSAEIDPGSFTVVRKGAGGGWATVS